MSGRKGNRSFCFPESDVSRDGTIGKTILTGFPISSCSIDGLSIDALVISLFSHTKGTTGKSDYFEHQAPIVQKMDTAILPDKSLAAA